MMNTHSFFHCTFASAQFFFFGKRPSHLKSTTRAPACSAITRVASLLPESMTTISSHQATDARHAARLAASFFTGIRTEMGAGAGMSAVFLLLLRAQVERGVAQGAVKGRAEREHHGWIGEGELHPRIQQHKAAPGEQVARQHRFHLPPGNGKK